MQVTETLAEGLKHEFKISVPASDLDAKADAKLVDLCLLYTSDAADD